MGPHLSLAFTLTECSNKGCWNLYGRMFKSNNGLLTSIHNDWTMKLYLEIAFVTIQNSFITCRRTTPYIFSRLIYFKIIHKRVMTCRRTTSYIFSRLIHFEIIHNRVMTDTLIQISRWSKVFVLWKWRISYSCLSRMWKCDQFMEKYRTVVARRINL